MATVATLFRTDRCLHRMVMATAGILLLMGLSLHRMVMATAETCVSFSFPFQAQGYSGLPAIPREVGVWL
jgi:hypothetical protein